MIGTDRHHVPPGVRARELQGCGGDRRSILGKLDHLCTRQQVEQRLRALDFDGGGAVEIAAELHLPVGRSHHLRVGMPQRHGAQAHAVLDELPPVRVPHTAALSAYQEPRSVGGVLVVALCVGMAPAGNQAVCFIGQGFDRRESGVLAHAIHDPSFLVSGGQGRRGQPNLTQLRPNRLYPPITRETPNPVPP